MPMLSQQIAIDSAFRDLIPPLAPDELALLETSIVSEGVREPLIVWPTEGRNILLDGHNRLAICRRHGLSFATRSMTFPDRDAAICWIIENQMGRRNLSAYARSVLALRLKDAYATRAKARQGTRTDLAANIGENSPRGSTAALSRLAGVSDHTLKRAAYLDTHAPPALRAELLAGATSINAAFMALRRDTKQRDHRALIAATPKTPPSSRRVL